MTARPLATALFTAQLHTLEDQIDQAIHRAAAFLEHTDVSLHHKDAVSRSRLFEDLVLIHQQTRALRAHYHVHSLESDLLYE